MYDTYKNLLTYSIRMSHSKMVQDRKEVQYEVSERQKMNDLLLKDPRGMRTTLRAPVRICLRLISSSTDKMYFKIIIIIRFVKRQNVKRLPWRYMSRCAE